MHLIFLQSSDIQIMPVSRIKIEDSFEEEVPVSKVLNLLLFIITHHCIKKVVSYFKVYVYTSIGIKLI